MRAGDERSTRLTHHERSMLSSVRASALESDERCGVSQADGGGADIAPQDRVPPSNAGARRRTRAASFRPDGRRCSLLPSE
jgi:hypothetical protein